MNTQILPLPAGTWKIDIWDMTTDDVQVELEYSNKEFRSVIGHQATADLINQVVPFKRLKIRKDRAAITLKPGDEVIQFILKSRLPEGVVLSSEELSRLNYSFRMVRVSGYSWYSALHQKAETKKEPNE